MLARLPAWKKMGYPGKMGINVQRGGGTTERWLLC